MKFPNSATQDSLVLVRESGSDPVVHVAHTASVRSAVYQRHYGGAARALCGALVSHIHTTGPAPGGAEYSEFSPRHLTPSLCPKCRGIVTRP